MRYNIIPSLPVVVVAADADATATVADHLSIENDAVDAVSFYDIADRTIL